MGVQRSRQSAEIAVLVQWAESQGQLSGSVQMFEKNSAEAADYSFRGIRSGNDISLTLERGVEKETWLGEIESGRLALRMPLAAGGFTTIGLKRGILKDYDAAVRKLKEAKSREDAEARRRLEEESQRQQRAQEEEAARIREKSIQKPILGGTEEAFVAYFGPENKGEFMDFRKCANKDDYEYTVSVTGGPSTKKPSPYNAAWQITRRTCVGKLSEAQAVREARQFFPPDAIEKRKPDGSIWYWSRMLVDALPHDFWENSGPPGVFELDLESIQDDDLPNWQLSYGCPIGAGGCAL